VTPSSPGTPTPAVFDLPVFPTTRRTSTLALAVLPLLAWPPLLPPAAADPAPTAVPAARTTGASGSPPVVLGDPGPDRTHYQRALIPGGRQQATTRTSAFTLVDLVVSAGLAGIDTRGGTETSIAIDPNNPNHITVSAFSEPWGNDPSGASLWVSTDGGATWQEQLSLSMPPGQPGANGGPIKRSTMARARRPFMAPPLAVVSSIIPPRRSASSPASSGAETPWTLPPTPPGNG
jgi:hypothetical protein